MQSSHTPNTVVSLLRDRGAPLSELRWLTSAIDDTPNEFRIRASFVNATHAMAATVLDDDALRVFEGSVERVAGKDSFAFIPAIEVFPPIYLVAHLAWPELTLEAAVRKIIADVFDVLRERTILRPLFLAAADNPIAFMRSLRQDKTGMVFDGISIEVLELGPRAMVVDHEPCGVELFAPITEAFMRKMIAQLTGCTPTTNVESRRPHHFEIQLEW